VRREIFVSLAIVAAAAGVAVADEQSGVRTWLQVRRDLATAQARVVDLEQRVEALAGESESLRNSPLALERAIREDLGLARPGETVVRGLDAEPAGPGGHPGAGAGAASGTPRNP
jgi:cell division protein FtsB